jgi:hypothetical protein
VCPSFGIVYALFVLLWFIYVHTCFIYSCEFSYRQTCLMYSCEFSYLQTCLMYSCEFSYLQTCLMYSCEFSYLQTCLMYSCEFSYLQTCLIYSCEFTVSFVLPLLPFYLNCLSPFHLHICKLFLYMHINLNTLAKLTILLIFTGHCFCTFIFIPRKRWFVVRFRDLVNDA